MLSRVANSIYWMNRYIERAENYARFVSVNFNLALDLPPDISEQWEPLIIATADHYEYYKVYDRATKEQVLDFMTFDKRNPNSILNSLENARENARTIRESISKEMWEHINQFYWRVKEANSQHQHWDFSQYQTFFNDVKMSSELFFGIVDSTITRGEGWHFGRLGKFIERADKTTRFLDVKYFTLLPNIDSIGSPLDLLLWSAVLKSVSAYNMFRQEYRIVNPSNITEFLILDSSFPRSIRYCLGQADRSLHEISGNLIGSTYASKGYANKAEKLMGKLKADVDFAEIEDVFEKGLHEYLDNFQKRINEVGDAVAETYFYLKSVDELVTE
jgi:uncharacterized alpha-E superfamily protein